MTTPTTQPTCESLELLNEVASVLRRVLQDYEIELEQLSLDERKADRPDRALTLKYQATTAYVASSKVQNAINALFTDTLERMNTTALPAKPPKLELVRSIELPNVTPLAKVVEVVE